MIPSKNPKVNSPNPSDENDCDSQRFPGFLPAAPPLPAPFIFASPAPLPLHSCAVLRFNDDDLLFALSVWLPTSAGLRLSVMEASGFMQASGFVTVSMALDAGAVLRQAQECQQEDLDRLIWSADLRDERCRRVLAQSWASLECAALLAGRRQSPAAPSFFGGCIRDVREFGLWILVAAVTTWLGIGYILAVLGGI